MSAEHNPLGSVTQEKVVGTAAPAQSPAPVRPVPRRYLRSKHRGLIIALAALIAVAASLVLWRYFSGYESTDDAQVDVHLYPVSARISGYVIKVNVNDNQYVEKGTVLVEIDPKDYQVAVDIPDS